MPETLQPSKGTTVKKEDRVALAQRPLLTGTILDVRGQHAEIDFDGGGRGLFKIEDLVKVDPNAPISKTWPPAGLETKAMT